MRMSLHRADAIHFEAALFTNLTQDHLDFHADMEDYFLAKRGLFEAGARHARSSTSTTPTAAAWPRNSSASPSPPRAPRPTTSPARSPSTPGRRRVHDALRRPGGDEVRVRTGMPGHFNVANALGAFAAAMALGVEPEDAAAGLARAARVPGRFEPIDEGQGFAVLVDYAHTPDSLENVLRAARRLTEGRLIAVFGAGGDRDRDKRPKMGRAGAELADLAIITSDNPRSEDPEAIVAEVAAGAGGRRRAGGRGRPPGGDRAGAGPGRARRHRRDRRQGARAGPGVRGRPQDPLRRPRGRPRGAAEAGQPGVRLTAAEIAAAIGRRHRRRGRRRAAPAGGRSTPARPGRATSSSACAARSRDGGEFAAGGDRGRGLGSRGPPSASPFASLSGAEDERGTGGAWVFAVADPLAALQALARAWRRALGARVVGVTGSVGKTSVKDIARALLPGSVHANRENLNTEIGLPLTVLEAPDGTDLLVLEMAMRGAGQIAELAAIAEPDVAVITNVGPVHVELLGSVEAIAAAKAEVLDSLPAGGVAVVPVEAGELEPHLARAPSLLRFGPGGDVEASRARVAEGRHRGADRHPGRRRSASTSPSPRPTT